jgi:hypothetical protein
MKILLVEAVNKHQKLTVHKIDYDEKSLKSLIERTRTQKSKRLLLL